MNLTTLKGLRQERIQKEDCTQTKLKNWQKRSLVLEVRTVATTEKEVTSQAKERFWGC